MSRYPGFPASVSIRCGVHGRSKLLVCRPSCRLRLFKVWEAWDQLTNPAAQCELDTMSGRQPSMGHLSGFKVSSGLGHSKSSNGNSGGLTHEHDGTCGLSL
ncbi:unnamed protein product [Cladocopium goreaui]|uniref:Uncharacterized protein n=1 Tax=Cladocopium goreaui TaxID=2562237 RepID=A0A9P1DJA0_9DINO|nr:unnamed protein product [Cladocopium goreaui]